MTSDPPLNAESVQRRLVAIRDRLDELRQLGDVTVDRRIIFVFDPERNAVLLVAGDKAGQWTTWYRQAIPLAEERYAAYLKERTQP